MMSLDQLDDLGSALNVAGILVAMAGLLTESRTRRWSLVGARGQRAVKWIARIWSKLRRRPEPPPAQVTMTGTAGGRLGLDGYAEAHWWPTVDPNASVAEVVDVLRADMRRLIATSEGKQEFQRKRQTKRIDAVRDQASEVGQRVAALDTRVTAEARAESQIASRSLRLEVWGLAVALTGTGLSSVASLLN
jgi:hypothetical protein